MLLKIHCSAIDKVLLTKIRFRAVLDCEAKVWFRAVLDREAYDIE